MTDYRKRLEALDDHERLTCPARYAECTCGYTAKLESFAAEAAAEADRLLSEVERMREALVRLRDCDWVITPLDRMDAVRDIARQALGDPE